MTKIKCGGITKIGEACKRFVCNPNKMCFQHKKQSKQSKPLQDCPICLEPKKQQKMDCCGNMICDGCLKKWKSKSKYQNCMYCRKEFDFPSGGSYAKPLDVSRIERIVIQGRILFIEQDGGVMELVRVVT